MYQQQFQQYPQYGAYGYGYAGRPTPKCTQPVTPELSKMLNQNSEELSVQISNTEKIRNWCTHKEPGTGRIALVHNPQDPEDLVTCRVCGAKFHIINDLVAKSSEAATLANDVLQTIKTIYLDISEDFLKAYSQTGTMFQLLPKLAEKAANNFGLYEAYSGNLYPNGPGMNTFQAASNIIGGFNVFGGQPMGGYYGYPQQQPMGQPMMYGQPPMGQPMGQQPQQMIYGQPPMGQPMGQYPNGAIPMGGAVMGQQPMGQPTVPQIDPNGNVVPGGSMAPPSVNTMGNVPVGGYNPFVAQPGGVAPPPAPTGPQQATVQQQTVNDPQQTKQIVV